MRALIAIALAACSSSPAETPDAPRAWATYTIAAGEHSAALSGREPKNPIDGVVSVEGRDYELVLNTSAIYELTNPVQPEDQLDWNKLPGFSDCGTIDLAVDGAMFGWRWRLDLLALEVTAYANNDGVHLTPEAPLFALDAADLAAEEPVRYRVSREPALYRFAVEGVIRGRPIAATATLPRRCPEVPLDELAWAGAFYFGGTSTAPHEITARIREQPFR
jgi:hypothetical protein